MMWQLPHLPNDGHFYLQVEKILALKSSVSLTKDRAWLKTEKLPNQDFPVENAWLYNTWLLQQKNAEKGVQLSTTPPLRKYFVLINQPPFVVILSFFYYNPSEQNFYLN